MLVSVFFEWEFCNFVSTSPVIKCELNSLSVSHSVSHSVKMQIVSSSEVRILAMISIWKELRSQPIGVNFYSNIFDFFWLNFSALIEKILLSKSSNLLLIQISFILLGVATEMRTLFVNLL